MSAVDHPLYQAAAITAFLPALSHGFSAPVLLAIPAAVYYTVLTIKELLRKRKDGPR